MSHRGGNLPGKFRIGYRDGAVKRRHHFECKDAAYNNRLSLYLPPRCHLWPDYSAEFSDITCSDIWLRDKNGDYNYPRGTPLILCRTERGVRFIELLKESEEVFLEPIDSSIGQQSYSHLKRERKVIPFIRIGKLQARRKGTRI